ncbi:unnamed protein product [Ophioblennius macclurei]
MSAHSSIFILVTLWASMQEGFGVPVPQPQQLDLEISDSIPTHRVRTKRCACSNEKDYECHYFCHLDIIWVNTPSKTTVYGLGGALARHKRSTDRCTCSNPDDHSCISFCHLRPAVKPSVERNQRSILRVLRAMGRKSHHLDKGLSGGKMLAKNRGG